MSESSYLADWLQERDRKAREESARIRTTFLEESAGLESDPPFAMEEPVSKDFRQFDRELRDAIDADRPSNDETMERFGYKICPQCNADQVADRFVGPFCEYCGEGEDR